jgi:hypothetical protein
MDMLAGGKTARFAGCVAGLDVACAIGAGVCMVALTSGTGAPTTRDVMPDPR